jgi:hypothetical protein
MFLSLQAAAAYFKKQGSLIFCLKLNEILIVFYTFNNKSEKYRLLN